MANLIEELKSEKLFTKHYYGDVVRFLFLLAAAIMLISLPFLNNNLPVPLIFSITTILSIGVLAGFTNPLQRTTAIINTGVSAISLVTFEYYAVNYYLDFSLSEMFVVNQILAFIFLFALYYSTKTLRAMLVQKK